MAEAAPQIGALAVGSINRRALGWWGMMTLILTEGSLFAYLLFSYFFLAAQYGRAWLPDELPGFALAGPNTMILLASSVAVWWGEGGIRAGKRGRLIFGLTTGLLLGALFVAIQGLEWADKAFRPWSNSYGSLYFTITGFHMLHVIAGVIMLAVVALWSALGYFDGQRHTPVAVASVYWHFVDMVWLGIFLSLYVTPHLV